MCVCVGGNGMFNTISKHCLLCLRLVSSGGSVVMVWLYQGRSRPIFFFLCLCASQLLFRYCCCSFRSTMNMCRARCVCVIAQQSVCNTHVCILCHQSHSRSHNSLFSSPTRLQRKHHLQLGPSSFVAPPDSSARCVSP